MKVLNRLYLWLKISPRYIPYFYYINTKHRIILHINCLNAFLVIVKPPMLSFLPIVGDHRYIFRESAYQSTRFILDDVTSP